MQARHSIAIQTYDAEATHRMQFGRTLITVAGGVRYAEVEQRYDVQRFDAAGLMSGALSHDHDFHGFGPKQARNLLQSLGLTRHEIPIDSRIAKWLNDFGFPVRLSASALGDRHYYAFVMDGVQALCRASEVAPCVLDAAIFASFDGGGWTEENIVW